MRQAAKAHGYTVNDVFLAAVSTGLAKYHDRHGKPTRRLRFNIPISLRSASKDGSHSNAVTIARFPLPVNGVSIEERLDAAHEEVRRWRDEPALALVNPVADVSWLVPVPILAGSMRTSDVTVSNVPGPPVPIYVSGSRVVGTWPLVATVGAALNITLVTYDGTANVGVSGDDAAIPDLDVLISDVRAGFAEVIGHSVGPADPVSKDKGRTPSHAAEVRRSGKGPKSKSPSDGGKAKKAPAQKRGPARKAAKKVVKKASARAQPQGAKAKQARRSVADMVEETRGVARSTTRTATEAVVDIAGDALGVSRSASARLLTEATDAGAAATLIQQDVADAATKAASQAVMSTGGAVEVAKSVVDQAVSATNTAQSTDTPKKVPAKQAAVKKTVAKKVPAKQAAVKKTVAKKVPAKKAAAIIEPTSKPAPKPKS
jgi:hypothetical protein